MQVIAKMITKEAMIAIVLIVPFMFLPLFSDCLARLYKMIIHEIKRKCKVFLFNLFNAYNQTDINKGA